MRQCIGRHDPPFSTSQVIAAFARHGLKLNVFARATDCGGERCKPINGIPPPQVELQVVGRDKPYVFDVVLYRTAADARRAFTLSVLRKGNEVLHVRMALLLHGNVAVTYVADTSKAPPVVQKLFREARAEGTLAAIRASLASLRLPR